ncbi:MAG: hypothetical protein WD470_01240 [Rhodospirillaceae bacterium]
MTSRHIMAAAAFAVPALLGAPAAYSQAPGTQAVLEEIREMKRSYEERIRALEAKLSTIEQQAAEARTKSAAPADGARGIRDNSFNPSIGVILNGKLSSFSKDSSPMPGFAIGEEGERGREGLGIDESELNFSANVDDRFYGSLTAAIVREDGEDKIELEEAFVQTSPGLGLPDGVRIKAGRAFWNFGYMNEHHAHADDFADRPLPYRTYLNGAYNDDGVQLSWVLPTEIFAEVGGGWFRGDDFPYGDSTSGRSAWSAYGRIGGDIGADQSWRLGLSALTGTTDGRTTDDVTFIGDTTLYAVDLRYTWAPTGNARNSEVTFQAEYFRRAEDGSYDDTDAGTGRVNFDDSTSGWYAQAIYKFLPAWRVGARYARLDPAEAPAGLVGSSLDADGHHPWTASAMGDWTSSEFGRFRLQYNREKLSSGDADNQFVLQYVISLGAHGAHAY